MAGARYYVRLLKRYSATPAFQLIAIFLCLFLGIRWVLRHNHDGDEALPPPAKPTASVEDEGIEWSKMYYVMYATSAEYLCNALMVWSEIEEIGSRAQVRDTRPILVTADQLANKARIAACDDVPFPLGSK
jgi:hypothetical protein